MIDESTVAVDTLECEKRRGEWNCSNGLSAIKIEWMHETVRNIEKDGNTLTLDFESGAECQHGGLIFDDGGGEEEHEVLKCYQSEYGDRFYEARRNHHPSLVDSS